MSLPIHVTTIHVWEVFPYLGETAVCTCSVQSKPRATGVSYSDSA
jgi:hypothetical protein